MDSTATELLTEHLNFPPIALIDDIINAVNAVMYKCTQAIESYLISKSSADDVLLSGPGVGADEVEVGTGKLETLLENTVDRNFDKLELYALRNILTIPPDLIQQGKFRLGHHKDVKFATGAQREEAKLDLEIRELFKELEAQVYLKKALTRQLKQAKAVVRELKAYREELRFIEGPVNNQLKENFYYVVTQTMELFVQCRVIMSQTHDHINREREAYLETETLKLLKVLGLSNDKPRINKVLQTLENVDLNNPRLKKALEDAFNLQV